MSYIFYIFREDERYSPGVYIDDNIDNISKIIARAENVKRIHIVNGSDETVLTTMGNYIDKCYDEDILIKILPTLIKYQERKNNPYVGNIKYNYDSETMSKESFESWIYKNFNYKLGEI